MDRNPYRSPEKLPLRLHALRLLATVAVFSAFRWRRPTGLGVFRSAMAYVFGRLAPRYEELSGRLPGGWQTYTTPIREAMGDRLIGPAPARALDMACGTAWASRVVAERFPSSTLIAADLALPMLEEARRIWAGRAPELHLVAADASSPPFRPGSFELVVVMNAPPEPEAVRELLAPGGRAVFAYSLPFSPVVRPQIRRRLERAGYARCVIRPSGLGTMVIAIKEAEKGG